MLSKKNYSAEHILEQIKRYPSVDPAKMEMTIFAFGLLEELIRAGVPLIFKGGTSLMLLFDNPKRVSTDIDIIVPPDVSFDALFERVKKRFPFYEGEERGQRGGSHFRHFYFMFYGPISGKECRVNLDVAFEKNPYPHTLEKELTLPFLLSSGASSWVSLPSASSVLGDKLTAFAPNTVGVNPSMTSLGKPIDNRLQVMKQFYDIARLSEVVDSLDEVLLSYRACLRFENEFRGTSFGEKECLLDAFASAASVASMGEWDKASSFYAEVARPGIQGLATNVFDGKYNQLSAAVDAAKVMNLIAALLCGCELKTDGASIPNKDKRMRAFKSIPDPEAFSLIRQAIQALTEKGLL